MLGLKLVAHVIDHIIYVVNPSKNPRMLKYDIGSVAIQYTMWLPLKAPSVLCVWKI